MNPIQWNKNIRIQFLNIYACLIFFFSLFFKLTYIVGTERKNVILTIIILVLMSNGKYYPLRFESCLIVNAIYIYMVVYRNIVNNINIE